MLALDDQRTVYRPECYNPECDKYIGVTANRAVYLSKEDAEESLKKWLEIYKRNIDSYSYPNSQFDTSKTRIVSRIEIHQIGEWVEV